MDSVLLETGVAGLIALPFVFFLGLALTQIVNLRPSEKVINFLACTVVSSCFMLALFMTGYFYLVGGESIILNFGSIYQLGDYRFEVEILVDRLSAPIMVVATFVIGVVGHFSSRYLHRDSGYLRFFLLYGLFAAGISLVIAAGTLDILFIGWEFVGLSSALLIGFYQNRSSSVRNGLLAFSYYRVCDLGLLLAATLWHDVMPGLGFADLGEGFTSTLASNGSTLWLIGGAILLASLGKSAQFPMCSWLPKAMEGPTPSSAIFYGALSVHAGAYLLLRSYPVFDDVLGIRWIMGAIGGSTALYATIVNRSSPDVKSSLAYACIAQVGLIFLEIACGWTTLATLHLIGHILLRTWQFLRSPSILHDFHMLKLKRPRRLPLARILPHRGQVWLFRNSLMGFNLDQLIHVSVIIPVVSLATRFSHWEIGWQQWLEQALTGTPTGDRDLVSLDNGKNENARGSR